MTPQPDIFTTIITQAPNFIFALICIMMLVNQLKAYGVALKEANERYDTLVKSMINRENCDDGAPAIFRATKPITPPARLE